MKNLIDVKKHSAALDRVLTHARLTNEIYMNTAQQALELSAVGSEVLTALIKDINRYALDMLSLQTIVEHQVDGLLVEYEDGKQTINELFEGFIDNDVITITGILINPMVILSKAEITEQIATKQFAMGFKQIKDIAASLKRYEEESNPFKKAVLSPSLGLAQKLLDRVNLKTHALVHLQKGFTIAQQATWKKTFHRTNISGVIHTASYLAHGEIKQKASTHQQKKLDELAVMLKESQFIDQIELDPDSDIDKVIRMLKQIEQLRLNIDQMFTLKVRKLGNYNARGLYVPLGNIVAEDTRNTSAVIHEIAHMVHMTKFQNDPFVEYIIEKYTALVKCDGFTDSQQSYFKKPTEIVARACEIGALFAMEAGQYKESEGMELIKERKFYEMNSDIYFNMTNIDQKEIDELIALYYLFFQTKEGNIIASTVENYKRQSSNYRKWQIAKRSDEKEMLELFAHVTPMNLEAILANEIPIKEMGNYLLSGINYARGHKRQTIEEWALTMEERATVVNSIITRVQQDDEESLFNWVTTWPNEVRRALQYFVSFSSFKSKNSYQIKRAMRCNNSQMNKFTDFYYLVKHSPIKLLTAKQLLDQQLVCALLTKEPAQLQYIDSKIVSSDLMKMYSDVATQSAQKPMIHPSLYSDESYMLGVIKTYPKAITQLDINLKHDVTFVKKLLKLDAEHHRHLDQKVLMDATIQPLYDATTQQLNYIKGERTMDEMILIANNTISSRVLDELSNRRTSTPVKEAIVKNPHTLYGTLLKIYSHSDMTIKNLIAVHPNAKSLPKVDDTAQKMQTNSSLSEYEELLNSGKITLFTRTDNQRVEQVLKIKQSIPDFKGFNQWMKESKKGYYSKFARGFILYEAYAKSISDDANSANT